MVGHHLPMIFATSLSIDHQYLVSIECGLHQIVELDGARERYMRISYPDVCGGKQARRHMAMDVLVSYELQANKLRCNRQLTKPKPQAKLE